jgi:UDP-3-O-[3-hydroxymyristoyl] glucosamine N-acyltransferase
VRLGEISQALGLELEGEDVDVVALAGLDDAGPGDLCFASGPRYRRSFERSRGGAFLLPHEFDALGRPCLRSATPYVDFARAIELFHPPRPRPDAGVHPTAVVAEDAVLAEGVSIGPFSVVGARSRIGERSVLHPHVTLYPDCVVGDDCIIHSGAHLREGTRLADRVVVQNGAVLGSDGFGHAYRADGSRFTIPHPCPVELDDEVEVGANATLDSSHPGQHRSGHAETLTRIGRGTKIDNLVHLGHGCSVGEAGTLCAQTGLAGSTRIGNHVLFGGQSASGGHLEVGNGAMIGARAAPAHDVEPGAQLLGAPAMGRREWTRFVMLRRRIPALFRRVRTLEQRLGIEREDSSE